MPKMRYFFEKERKKIIKITQRWGLRVPSRPPLDLRRLGVLSPDPLVVIPLATTVFLRVVC